MLKLKRKEVKTSWSSLANIHTRKPFEAVAETESNNDDVMSKQFKRMRVNEAKSMDSVVVMDVSDGRSNQDKVCFIRALLSEMERILENHPKHRILDQYRSHELSALETVFAISNIRAQDRDNRFYYLMGEIMFQAAYNRGGKIEKAEHSSGRRSRLADYRSARFFSKEVIPKTISDADVKLKYEMLLGRMSPSNELTQKYMASLNELQLGGDKPITAPKTILEFKWLAVLLFDYFYDYKSYFANYKSRRGSLPTPYIDSDDEE